MANSRSRRLRKKLRIDEFEEHAFDVSWRFADDTSDEAVDQLVDRFIRDVIEPRQLGFAGGGHLGWEGLVCTERLGKCTEADREAVEKWLNEQGLSDVQVSPLYDLWYGNEV